MDSNPQELILRLHKELAKQISLPITQPSYLSADDPFLYEQERMVMLQRYDKNSFSYSRVSGNGNNITVTPMGIRFKFPHQNQEFNASHAMITYASAFTNPSWFALYGIDDVVIPISSKKKFLAVLSPRQTRDMEIAMDTLSWYGTLCIAPDAFSFYSEQKKPSIESSKDEQKYNSINVALEIKKKDIPLKDVLDPIEWLRVLDENIFLNGYLKEVIKSTRKATNELNKRFTIKLSTK